MISVAEADRLLRDHVRLRAAIDVPLAQAGGHILRENIPADRDYPPFDRAAMDGIAVSFEDIRSGIRTFSVRGVQRAGVPPSALTSSATCVEIMTGAALPKGADTVIRYEDLEIEHGCAKVQAGVVVSPRQNVHRQGTDRKCGEIVLQAGIRLFAPQIAVLASLGCSSVRVAQPWRVSFLTTGDELVDVGDTVLPHQIRRSNGHAMAAALQRAGGTVRLLHAPDDEAALRARFEAALADSDALLISGGVSMGKFDLVPRVLASLQVQRIFHKVAQKPGKPIWFGITADGRPVFGLPGNPVSALVGFFRYVVPFFEACQAATSKPLSLLLDAPPKGKKGLTHFVPVRQVGVKAIPIQANGSGDFVSLAESDGFVEVTPDLDAGVERSAVVPFFPWSHP